MPFHTPLFIITSARPRVGKTLIARALAEYFLAQNREVAAFDVNPGEDKLIDYLPDCTAVANVQDTFGEVALFDRLIVSDRVVKVVDVGHMAIERFFAVMAQIDLMSEMRRRGVVPAVLFVADPDERSSHAYSRIGARFPDLRLVPVFNQFLLRLEPYHLNFPPSRRGGEPIEVPALSPVVRSVVDRPNFSFIAYAEKTADKTSELFDWMRHVFVAFHDLEGRLQDTAAPQLRHTA